MSDFIDDSRRVQQAKYGVLFVVESCFISMNDNLIVFKQAQLNSFIILMEVEPEQYADQFEITTRLGDGGQANVYLGAKGSQTYALKVYGVGATKEAAYKIEAELLGKLKHPNLINMVTHRPQAKFKLSNSPQEKRHLIVLDLAQGGQLFDYISKTGKFGVELTRTYVKQILSAIAYLNDVGITHRDLKPQNILFDKDFTLKISDFGLARDSKGNIGDYKLKSRVGTEGYKAPEIELGLYDGLKVDLFATGVILFIMYTGTPPFLSTKSHDRIYRLIRERRYADFWKLHQKNKAQGFYSQSFKRLINSFLSAEPDRRPTFESLQNDEWLGGHTLTQSEVIEQMTNRAVKIGLKKFLNPVNINEACKKEGHRSNLDLQDNSLTKEEVLSYYYFNTNIDAKQIPLSDKKNTIELNKQPRLIVSWIKFFLYEQRKDQNAFLADFVEDLKLVRYEVDFQESKAQIKIKICFQINCQDQTEVVLLGDMVRSSQGKVGISWIKSQGNSFWLSAIKEQINQSFTNIN